MRRLILFRHGKSDWHAPHGSDHERPLNKRGIEAAKVMGRVLARSGLDPDHAISSSAVRAKTTLEFAHEAGGWECGVEVTDALYGTTAKGALAVACEAPSDAQSLMLVGHEPTWSEVAHRVTGGSVVVKTATVVGIDLAIDDWRHVDTRGSVVFVFQPRAFAGWI